VGCGVGGLPVAALAAVQLECNWQCGVAEPVPHSCMKAACPPCRLPLPCSAAPPAPAPAPWPARFVRPALQCRFHARSSRPALACPAQHTSPPPGLSRRPRPLPPPPSPLPPSRSPCPPICARCARCAGVLAQRQGAAEQRHPGAPLPELGPRDRALPPGRADRRYLLRARLPHWGDHDQRRQEVSRSAHAQEPGPSLHARDSGGRDSNNNAPTLSPSPSCARRAPPVLSQAHGD
jgi:hypothetical protein